MAAPFALDIYRDRQHRMIIRGPVTIYRSATPEWRDPHNAVVAAVSEKDAVRVRRIRYEKDYVAVRVQLDGGLEGYVFAETTSISCPAPGNDVEPRDGVGRDQYLSFTLLWRRRAGMLRFVHRGLAAADLAFR